MKLNNWFRKSTVGFYLLIACTFVKGQVWMPSVFSDNMVLQQKQEINFWGTAKPGELITITVPEESVKTTAGTDGKWSAKLKPMKAGSKAFDITVKGTNTIVLKNVLVGEVWLCSGQSNMDMTVAKEDRYWCGVNNEAQEVASANYPDIRVFDVDFTPCMQVKKDVSGKWEECSPKTVGHFSAAAYFFARELYNKYKIPVGLITSAYGASTAEAWISKKSLEMHPNLAPLLDTYSKKYNAFCQDSSVSMPKYRELLQKWQGDMAAAKAESGDVNASQNMGRKAPRAPRNPDPCVDQHNPYVLYNGMIAPLAPFTIKGVLWYQGESNGPSANQYREIMETLIADWRNMWQQGNFPFIYVQLANHQDLITLPIKEDPMVTVRNAQLQNLSVPNTAMVVAIDNANPADYGNIHPKDKQTIGLRLSLAAGALAYGEKMEYMGPLYQKMKTEDKAVRIFFSHTGSGLSMKGDTLKGFAIAGEDKNWVHAKAVIDGNTIVVSGQGIDRPLYVRYGWAKNPPCNLYNKEGLPASPFRTDEDE